jgi:2-amino-4-hydroxy-6-hydroxymethyldihydropteridine diphosphokinase
MGGEVAPPGSRTAGALAVLGPLRYLGPMDVVVGLGGNLGDRRATLAGAARELTSAAESSAVSSLYETAPIGPPQPDFLNAAVRLRLELTPRELLLWVLELERRAGRERRERWGARQLDLDVLFIEGAALAEPDLVVPHPRLHERRFALAPLLEVAPGAADPRSGTPLSEWLARLPDQGVRRLSGPEWAETGRF